MQTDREPFREADRQAGKEADRRPQYLIYSCLSRAVLRTGTDWERQKLTEEIFIPDGSGGV